jgi:hypothetical protein
MESDTRIFAIPHENLNRTVNRNIVRSEVEGGVYLRDLAPGSAIEIKTRNRLYMIVMQAEGEVLISGHPDFCPDPVRVKVDGSNWGGSMLKQGFIGRGMRLEFRHPVFQTVTTSPIFEIRQVA